MAKTKSDQLRLAVNRLLEDEETQAHVRTAAQRFREAANRARRRRPSKAVEDKKLYDKVREAATSANRAGRSLRAKPEPKRRGRKLALLAAAAAGGAVAIKNRKEG